MSQSLRLEVTNYIDTIRWRWALYDDRGNFLADHNVHLNPNCREYAGFLDLSQYLDYYQPIISPERQLADLGAWIGEQVFGGLRHELIQQSRRPAMAVQMIVPQAAQELLARPFELACFAGGKRFWEEGVRFIYQLEGVSAGTGSKDPTEKALRVLAAFSLPSSANPLNLRRERHGLQRLVRELNQTKNLAVELHVLQYGATRETLRDTLEESEGWDIIHLSGHGFQGELLLEDDRGENDSINADELGDLLDLARSRLKLLILDASNTDAGSHTAARVQVGLDAGSVRQQGALGGDAAESATTALPSLAQSLAQRLDCAALAMRYPVGDAFASELILALYEKLLVKGQPLPAALHLALSDALKTDVPNSPLSSLTPILIGPRAAASDLGIKPPQPGLRTVGLGDIPREPDRFVGRLQPMLRASQALAPRSAKRGVFFYGMPGAGKTACALELAHRHAEKRFDGYVWYRAPEAGSDIKDAFLNVLVAIERQVDKSDLKLTTALDDAEILCRRLRDLLQQRPLLLVFDNLETLLTDSNDWRDKRWGSFVAALLEHNGYSRVVLTARRLPVNLKEHPQLQVEAIHALSFAESVLLARELPNLSRLFNDDKGKQLLQQTLRVVQGHPKLLELANGLAADRGKLAARVAAANDELLERGDALDDFFAAGGAREGETRQEDADFVQGLQRWTTEVSRYLDSTANLLLQFLCQLEPPDRRRDLIDITWPDFLSQLAGVMPIAAKAFAEAELGLPPALASLEAANLVEETKLHAKPSTLKTLTGLKVSAYASIYTIHPGVSEAVRSTSSPAVLAAADTKMGDYFVALYQTGRNNEMAGGWSSVEEAGRNGASYLLRQARWGEAYKVLKNLLHRNMEPDTRAFAIPLLDQIIASVPPHTADIEINDLKAFSAALAGRIVEAERIERQRITDAGDDFQQAWSGYTRLASLLINAGREKEALVVIDELATYSRAAGLGPWTQMSNEVLLLEVQQRQGLYAEVLTRVNQLRLKMLSLPVTLDAKEPAQYWNVRERVLRLGRSAASRLNNWDEDLALSAELAGALGKRGASPSSVAGVRAHDYFPLLRLRRYADADIVLQESRAVFDAEHDIGGLGFVYSSLADLRNELGDIDDAVAFEKVALRYKYLARGKSLCAVSHNNLANYIERQQGELEHVLAHRLAAAVIWMQLGEAEVRIPLNSLVVSSLPHQPPTFSAVTTTVEQVDGVQFAELFARLPQRLPDGDAVVAQVWQLTMTEKLLRSVAAGTKNDSLRPQIEPVLADLETKGLMLRQPIHRIWAGERDGATLTTGLDASSTQLVHRILDLIGQA